MNGLGNATSSSPAQPAAAAINTSSVTITHTSSQNGTTFTVSSPTKKQTVLSIAKKSTSPSKFFNNSSANGVRTSFSNLNVGNRFHDLGAAAAVSDHQQQTTSTSSSVDESNGNRLRKCVVKVTEMNHNNNNNSSSNDRYKLKRLSMTEANGNAAKRFDDGAVKKSNLTSSKSFNAGPLQSGGLSKKQQLARSNSITSRRMDSSGQGQGQSLYGQGASDSRNGSSLESTVSFFNELIFKHFKTSSTGQPPAPGKSYPNVKAKLQEELESKSQSLAN